MANHLLPIVLLLSITGMQPVTCKTIQSKPLYGGDIVKLEDTSDGSSNESAVIETSNTTNKRQDEFSKFSGRNTGEFGTIIFFLLLLDRFGCLPFKLPFGGGGRRCRKNGGGCKPKRRRRCRLPSMKGLDVNGLNQDSVEQLFDSQPLSGHLSPNISITDIMPLTSLDDVAVGELDLSSDEFQFFDRRPTLSDGSPEIEFGSPMVGGEITYNESEVIVDSLSDQDNWEIEKDTAESTRVIDDAITNVGLVQDGISDAMDESKSQIQGKDQSDEVKVSDAVVLASDEHSKPPIPPGPANLTNNHEESSFPASLDSSNGTVSKSTN